MAATSPVPDQTPTKETESRAVPITDSWKRWYLVGTASVGLAIGFFAGNSDSPVVSTLLPLLFALIAGSGGMYLLKQDFTAPQAQERMRVFGISILLLCGFAVLAGVVGVAVRTGTGLNQFLPHWNEQPENSAILQTKNVEGQLSLLMLRKKLRVLGASEDEQQAVLSAFRFDPSAIDATKLRKTLAEAVSDCKAAAVEVDKDNKQVKSSGLASIGHLDELPPLTVGTLTSYLDFLNAACPKLEAWSSTSNSIASPAFDYDLKAIVVNMPGFGLDGSLAVSAPRLPTTLLHDPPSVGIRPSWEKLRVSLLELDAIVGPIWEPGGALDQQLDSTIGGTKVASDENEEDEPKSRTSFRAHVKHPK